MDSRAHASDVSNDYITNNRKVSSLQEHQASATTQDITSERTLLSPVALFFPSSIKQPLCYLSLCHVVCSGC